MTSAESLSSILSTNPTCILGQYTRELDCYVGRCRMLGVVQIVLNLHPQLRSETEIISYHFLDIFHSVIKQITGLLSEWHIR